MPTTPSRGGGYSADTLYFTTEFSGDNELNTGRIYLGGTLMAKPSVWEELPEPSPSPYQMVDLGLPSGLKWADRNVGAASPEAYGDYFMWGSTTPDTDNVCDWEHAPFNNGQEDFDEEYFSTVSATVCPGGVLAPAYDAANVIMGGSWRMPTSAEMQELLDGATRSVEELNGISGMRFTSTANGNSIFMPFAGNHSSPIVNNVGDYGYVWSSSLSAGDVSSSCSLDFGNGYTDISDYQSSCYGFVVRGVCQ